MEIPIVDNYPYYFKLWQHCDSENTDLHDIHHCTAKDCSITYKPTHGLTEDFQKDLAENNRWEALLKYWHLKIQSCHLLKISSLQKWHSSGNLTLNSILENSFNI